VIGDPVNEAARLCDLAKEREMHVLASDAALSRASETEAEAWHVGDRTVLRGRLEATGLASPVS
jgi:adenylate cyclase